MALINCKNCGQTISDQAAFCPHCGTKTGLETNGYGTLTFEWAGTWMARDTNVHLSLNGQDTGNKDGYSFKDGFSVNTPITSDRAIIGVKIGKTYNDDIECNFEKGKNYTCTFSYSRYIGAFTYVVTDDSGNVVCKKGYSKKLKIKVILSTLFLVGIFAINIIFWGNLIERNTERDANQAEQVYVSENNEQIAEETTTESVTDNAKDMEPENQWYYSKDVDDLSDEVTSINAMLVSENEIEYETGRTTKLAIGVHYSSATGILCNHVNICFVGDQYGSCQYSDFQGSGFLATFDDGPIDDTWKLVTMVSNRRGLTIHFDKEVNSFLSKLKQSRTCKIQVNLEHVGKKTFVFHCEGFEWDYE